MKKFTALLAILLVVCSLCVFAACDPGTVYIEREDLAEVVSVELVNYDNPKQKQFFSWVPDHTADLKPLDGSKMSVVETLDADKISDLLDTLSECPILDRYYAFDSPDGLCLKLTYASGDYLIVNCYEKSFAGYIGRFHANGEVDEFIGCFDAHYSFEVLVNNFFQTQI